MQENSKAKVIENIKKAWSEERYTSAIDSELQRLSSHPEENEANALFIGRIWQDLPCEVARVNYPNVFLIPPIALRYYLPSFLICAIEDDTSDLSLTLVDVVLRVPKKTKPLTHFLDRFSSLTHSQKNAVACFMHYVATQETQLPKVRRRAIESVERFWADVR